jgi:hypothetical protein
MLMTAGVTIIALLRSSSLLGRPRFLASAAASASAAPFAYGLLFDLLRKLVFQTGDRLVYLNAASATTAAAAAITNQNNHFLLAFLSSAAIPRLIIIIIIIVVVVVTTLALLVSFAAAAIYIIAGAAAVTASPPFLVLVLLLRGQRHGTQKRTQLFLHSVTKLTHLPSLHIFMAVITFNTTATPIVTCRASSLSV